MPIPLSRKGDGLRRALFLCMDNYLASRFCEELFNSLVRAEGLNWQAVSRGLSAPAARVTPEPMAPEAVERLRAIGAAPVNHRRLPLAAAAFDLEMSFVVVAIAPRGQHAAIGAAWPRFSGQIEFWSVAPGRSVQALLNELTFSVRHMVDTMLGRASRATPAAAERGRNRPDSAKLRLQSPMEGELEHVRVNKSVTTNPRAPSGSR
jgi:protein-tyrosine-phosphatase